MQTGRTSGILCHITSLPGRYGTGTLGQEAFDFLDLAATGGFSWMQILPVGPVSPSMGWSPYSSISAFAGNELFISTDSLAAERWGRTLAPHEPFAESARCNFNAAREHTRQCIITSFNDFIMHASAEDTLEFSQFCEDHNDNWLDDYALFTAIAHEHQSYNWTSWEKEIALREADALDKWRLRLADRCLIIKYGQFIFFRQWKRFREHASSRGIKIIGDIPIYVSMDSADAWSHKNILTIDPDRLEPISVAGVPPDYFSDTGQLWGNPLYRWHDTAGSLMEETYSWWKKRISHTISLCDVVRIDHFRGFDAFWSVAYGNETAVNGQWVTGPGLEFFTRLRDDIGDLPLIAEDLGVITETVRELRDTMGFPGMKILQFAFDGGPDNEYLPHNIYGGNCVVYTGTHDNDTTNGWFYDPDMPREKRDYIMEYLGMNDWSDFHWRLIREAYVSPAGIIIIPAQDILGYGSEFRMNMPGTTEGNWEWKLLPGELNAAHMKRLHRMSEIFSRLPVSERNRYGQNQ